MPSGGIHRLDSWKAIAEFLGRDISTVRRWEHECGLPVHRVAGAQGRSVFAFTDELEQWLGCRTNGNGQGSFQPTNSVAGSQQAPDSRSSPAVLAPESEIAADRARHRGRKRYLWVAAGIALAAVAAFFIWPRRSKLTSRDSIVLADFTNATGDPVFDGTLREGLGAQLAQSPFLNPISDEQVAETLRLMGQPLNRPLSNALARQVCQRSGGTAVLEGWIGQIGGEYDLTLSAVNCSTGALLASAQALAHDKADVLAALGSVASSIRSKLGESLKSIQRFNAPLARVTTPSLEALQAYTLGWEADLSGNEFAAVASLNRAIALDPNFAMAYAVLGAVYHNLGETGLATESLEKAYPLRYRVSERENFYISSHYEAYLTGNLEKADQLYELWARTYPRDVTPRINLFVDDYTLGRFDKARSAGHSLLALTPDTALVYLNLANTYLRLDRLDQAGAILRQAKMAGVDSPYLHETAYELASLSNDAAAMAREVAWASGKPGVEILALGWQSNRATCAGQLVQADDLTHRAVGIAEQAGQKEAAALLQAGAAVRAAILGGASVAREQALAAAHESRGRDTLIGAALALAFAGDVTEAQQLAEDLARRLPQDTVLQFMFLPTIRAAIALDEKSPSTAVAELRAASAYDFAPAGFLLPVYVRGQAYLEAGQGRQAAEEFQKIAGQPRAGAGGFLVALAQLELGRAHALSGDKPGALKAYQDFLILWRQADPQLPILRQAKSEYARLKRGDSRR